MADDHALEALEEVRNQTSAAIPSELLNKLLKIEHMHMFDEQQGAMALREVDALIDAYLQEQTDP